MFNDLFNIRSQPNTWGKKTLLNVFLSVVMGYRDVTLWSIHLSITSNRFIFNIPNDPVQLIQIDFSTPSCNVRAPSLPPLSHQVRGGGKRRTSRQPTLSLSMSDAINWLNERTTKEMRCIHQTKGKWGEVREDESLALIQSFFARTHLESEQPSGLTTNRLRRVKSQTSPHMILGKIL